MVVTIYIGTSTAVTVPPHFRRQPLIFLAIALKEEL
jgi:hypothetical protein